MHRAGRVKFIGQFTSTKSSKNVNCSLIRICARLSQNKDWENKYTLKFKNSLTKQITVSLHENFICVCNKD